MNFIHPSAQLFHPIFGLINLYSCSGRLYKVTFPPSGDQKPTQNLEPSIIFSANRWDSDIAMRLLGYLTGSITVLDIPIDWTIFPKFQLSVLKSAFEIPFGTIRTYGQMAARLGDLQKSRAVGAALGKNPIPIVIPCHRVVGANGSLHGYSGPGGLTTKAWLLNLEGHPFLPDHPFILQKDKNGNFK